MLSDFTVLMKLMCSSPRSGLGSSGRYISNVSLDVLPVKGPPLSPSGPVLKQTELNLENTWSIKPEQLVLTAPTISKFRNVILKMTSSGLSVRTLVFV